ncbi:MAG TPA: hypothetical protein VGL99_08680 [Chloroflexota bacterium]
MPTHSNLACTVETFKPVSTERVRWLDENADYALAHTAWAANGVPLTREDWHAAHAEGFRYCGIVEDERLVASAAAWAYSDAAWELAAARLARRPFFSGAIMQRVEQVAKPGGPHL